MRCSDILWICCVVVYSDASIFGRLFRGNWRNKTEEYIEESGQTLKCHPDYGLNVVSSFKETRLIL